MPIELANKEGDLFFSEARSIIKLKFLKYYKDILLFFSYVRYLRSHIQVEGFWNSPCPILKEVGACEKVQVEKILAMVWNWLHNKYIAYASGFGVKNSTSQSKMEPSPINALNTCVVLVSQEKEYPTAFH